jgi:predicted Zn finger-like uncharacterized protein
LPCQRFFGTIKARVTPRNCLSPRRGLSLLGETEQAVKFLCDRCKTRYSISDERVRGKILKIRCKSCGTIITVREGMTADPDAAQPVDSEYPVGPKNHTMVAPTGLNEGAANGTRDAVATERLRPSAQSSAQQGREPAGAGTPVAGARESAGVAKSNAGAALPVMGARGAAGAAKSNAGTSVPVIGSREPAGAAKDKAGAALPVAGTKEPAELARGKVGVAGAAVLQAKRTAPSDDAARGPGGTGKRGVAPEPSRGEPVNALSAAFASAMAKPPPALEEEWYVSIDGDQAGPFLLAEARHWVAQKAFDAELHCWTEGFDDWLPVDKVSHFRGLRKRPTVPAVPPPFPRGIGAPERGAPGRVAETGRSPEHRAMPEAPDQRSEGSAESDVRGGRMKYGRLAAPAKDESKPVFAATMASLERGPVAPVGLSLPSPGTRSARATPPGGTALPSRQGPARPSPSGSDMLARGAERGREPGAIGDAERRGPNGAKIAETERSPEHRAKPEAPARRSEGSPDRASSEPGDPFDHRGAGAETQIEAAPFGDSFVEPGRAVQSMLDPEPAPSGSDAALTAPYLPASATLQGTGANAAMTSAASPPLGAAASDLGGGDGDDELAIGEVSRVVKLGDISRARSPARRASTAAVVGQKTGANPILRPTASLPSLSPGATQDAAGAPVALEPGDPGMTMAPIAKAHRRGLIVLISVAGVMVLGVVSAVVLLVTTDDDPTAGNLGTVQDIDTSRPEDPITHRPINRVGSANPAANPLPRPHGPGPARPNPNLNLTGGNHDPEPLPGNSLRGDEIEDVAHKHQDMTQRCYLRVQRGADGILIGDVMKIAVTLMIDKDGNVSDVQLSDHAADNLGKCLAGSIRGWKFRQSSGGTFRFSLNFVSG